MVIEGDSKIVINTVQRLSTATPLTKLSKHLRLDWLKEKLRGLLNHFQVLQLNHIRRTGNKMANHLANYGADGYNEALDHEWMLLQVQSLND